MKKLTFIFIVFALVACNKPKFEDAKFRCKINGNEFVVKDKMATASYISNNFTLKGTRATFNLFDKKPFGEMELDFYLDSSGVFSSLNTSTNVFTWGNNGDEYGEQTYRSTDNDPGEIFITSIDYSAKNIEGTFNLTAYTDDGTSVEITDGYFNLDW